MDIDLLSDWVRYDVHFSSVNDDEYWRHRLQLKFGRQQLNVIVIENTKILNVKQCKYLGVCIDNDLKWTEHINLLCDRQVKYSFI